MTEPIKLPPLPYPIAYAIAASNTGLWVKAILSVDAGHEGVELMDQKYVGRLITTEQAEAYTRHAIEADRKHTDDLIARYQEKIRALEAENHALISELNNRQAQDKPKAWYTEDHLTDKSATTYDPVVADRWRERGWPVNALYTAPQPQQTSNDWKDAVDHELVTLGSTADSYASPKQAIQDLLDWHVSMAVDPAINGGFKLVPIEPTKDMLFAAHLAIESDSIITTAWLHKTIYQAMVGMAPRP